MDVARKTAAGTVLTVLTAVCPCAALALNLSHDINQYASTAWTVRAGFFDSAIFRIAQTPDGYLWLGSEFGLFRFDGVRSIPWQPPAGHLADESVYCLLESAQRHSLDWRVCQPCLTRKTGRSSQAVGAQ